MPRTLAMALALASTLIVTSHPARACGDTSLDGGHGAFCPIKQGARGSVLVVRDPSDPDGSLLRDPGLEAVLSSSGMTPSVVSGLDAAKQALAEKSFTVILAGLENAPALKALIDASPRKAALLPVVHNASKEAAASARETYGRVVTSPTRARALVAAVTDAFGR